jgi:hypothetical protein
MTGAGKPWGSTLLVLARHRCCSEARFLEAGSASILRTVGWLGRGPKSNRMISQRAAVLRRMTTFRRVTSRLTSV